MRLRLNKGRDKNMYNLVDGTIERDQDGRQD
jgi:hypothetical protein